MNDRLQVLAQVSGLAVLAAAGLLLVATRSGRLGATTSTAPAPPTSDLYAALPTLPPPTTVPTAADGPGGRPVPTPSPTPTVRAHLVGIIAGHWQLDSGAVCPDGLREVDVTTDVALRVRALLEYRGFEVDLLPEQNPADVNEPLRGYRAAALVSIHADSCDVPGVSGFKVARGVHSTTPEQDDRLVACLEKAYGAATLLPTHDDTITPDMWNYYVFREIGGETPAAIIELGFLNGDRDALDRLRYEMALGIANGVSCFLE